ncbi:unnamed protein product [Amoebophrya sp. A25]|nr:unnamed protein product [Amoebophrya sp. A25]|eukprot:GSA25T00012528001.1
MAPMNSCFGVTGSTMAPNSTMFLSATMGNTATTTGSGRGFPETKIGEPISNDTSGVDNLRSRIWDDESRVNSTLLACEMSDGRKALIPKKDVGKGNAYTDTLQKQRVNLYSKSLQDPRAAQEPVIIDRLSELSRPGLESLDFTGRIPYQEPPPIWLVINGTEEFLATAGRDPRNGTRMERHPQMLHLEEGDLVLKKFNPKGNFSTRTYEEEEFVARAKFPHISDKTFENMRGDIYIWCRKLGAAGGRMSVDNRPFAEVGTKEHPLIDSQEGFVPISILENRAETNWPAADCTASFPQRAALQPRFKLP